MRIDVREARSHFPALETFVWFQNGGVSITPRPVADVHAALMHELFERGPVHIAYPDEEMPRRAASIERIAAYLGVGSGDLALTRGVSEAFQTVLRGLDWAKGDEILITAEEEAALFLPVLQLRDLFGVRVVKAPLLEDETEQVAAFADRMGPHTRLVAFSHVTTDTGHRMPVSGICGHAREVGALSFVDMAHSAGVFPIDLANIGCDFAGLLSYKWFYAPYASGVLYVRPDRIDTLRVTYAGGRSESFLDWDDDRYESKPTAERFQYGPWSWPLVHAWASSLDFLDGYGGEAIACRTAALTSQLKKGLHGIDGVNVLTPQSFARSAALVTFTVPGDPVVLQDRLRDRWNIVIKATHSTLDGLRASIPFFLLEDEVDLLIEAISKEVIE
jgi:cysteine desulfurase/selenocysteine lyase